jgi:hypothetical protein
MVVRRAGQIAVEYCVRCLVIIEINQIHQREREVVENIRRRDRRIEFDGIEQARRALNQRNIGQMKVAMAAPHEPLPGAPLKQRLERRNMIVAPSIKLINRGSVKPVYVTEFCGVAVDNPGNGGEPCCAIGARRLVMRLQDGICDSKCKGWSDLLPPGDAIQRLLLVKASHFDRPFDRNTASSDFKATIIGARNRHNLPVDLRGIACIDVKLLFAGLLALCERRIIEKR